MSFELESLEETAFNAVYHDLLNSLIDFLQSGSEANVDVEISGVVEGSDALKEEAVHEEPEENLSNKTKLENLEVVSKPIKQIREKLVNSNFMQRTHSVAFSQLKTLQFFYIII